MNIVLSRLATLWLLLLSLPLLANQIDSVRIWPSPDSTRIVFDMQQKPEFRLLQKQGRLLTLEIEQVSVARLGKMSGESELLKSIRVQKIAGRQAVRVLLDLNRETSEKAFYLTPMDRYGHRLVLDLTDVVAEKSYAVPAAPNRKPVSTQTATGRDIVIAVDAGHGGHDPGAVGPKGTYEKHVTLAVAEKLMTLINQQPGFKAVLTRTGDYYVYPSKRPDVARSKQADFLVSIHADAAENRKATGASVWVLSLKRATTEVGRMMEKTEQHSELLGGVAEVIKDSANERYLAQTVLDLSMNHSMSTGFDAAKHVLRELGQVTRLHSKEPLAASLGVLKAPDIPSILVEIGFISNHAEEQKLKASSHQHKLAKAVFHALKKHFEAAPPADSLLAVRKNGGRTQSVVVTTNRGNTAAQTLPAMSPPANSIKPVASSPRLVRHKVQPGESLSMLARKYGVPMSRLREVNALKSDNLLIGQVLKVPQS